MTHQRLTLVGNRNLKKLFPKNRFLEYGRAQYMYVLWTSVDTKSDKVSNLPHWYNKPTLIAPRWVSVWPASPKPFQSLEPPRLEAVRNLWIQRHKADRQTALTQISSCSYRLAALLWYSANLRFVWELRHRTSSRQLSILARSQSVVFESKERWGELPSFALYW